MNKSPILIVDNNEDDMVFVQQAVNAAKLERQVYYFLDGDDLIKFLHETTQTPFIIISDVNLKAEDAFELKKQISSSPTLNYKAIPFVYWSAVAIEREIQLAYDVHSQGLFFKPFALDELCDTLQTIVKYWEKSKHPIPVV